MQQWTKFSLGWARIVGISAALFISACGATAAPGQGRAGAPGQSTLRDTASWETLAESPAAPLSSARVTRMGGKWVRPKPTDQPLKVPSRTIEAAAGTLATSESEPLFSPAGGIPPSPAAGASFGAVLDDGSRFNPDAQGAVGPNHLMATLSSQVRVQDRSGNTLSSMTLAQFWSGLSTEVFDPRVLYDPVNQRWIHTAVANPGQPNAGLLIAVSQTANPTGNWFRHFIGVGPTNSISADSPNVGFTKDWITVQANMFDNTNFNFFSSDIWAFNKANLYNGATATYRHFRYSEVGISPANALVPAVTYDNAFGTNFLVANWVGDYFSTEVGTIGLLRLFSISGPVDAPVFNDYATEGGLFVFGSAALYNPPWADFDPVGTNFAPQLGTTEKIFIGDARIQNVVFRNSTLWCAHHVFLPFNNPTRSAVQWFNITAGGTVLQRGRVDDASGVKFFAYPSIAVNQSEDVLLGYSRFGADQYPSANYSFHGFEDFPGTLRGDAVLKAGEAPFAVRDAGGFINWGDWSATVADPNGIDLWTLQEYAAARSGAQDRWGTWWGVLAPPTSLGVTMTGPASVLATANATYSVRVTNNLLAAATGVRLVDVLPSGAVYVSAVASQGSCTHSAGVVTCEIGTLAGRTSVSATIVARLNVSGPVTNRATVTAFGPDDTPSDNTATVTTTVSPASDISVAIVDSPDPVPLNTTLTYQVNVSNAGPSPAPMVLLTNTIPGGVTYISAVPGQGTCTRNGTIVSCNLGTVLPGSSVPVTIRVTPTSSALLTNTAVVAMSGGVDPVPANNSIAITTRANAVPTVTTIASRSTPEDVSTPTLPFTVGDAETAAGSLVPNGFSSDPSIVPAGNIVFGGSGSSRNLTVTPAPNASGIVTVYYYMTDADGGSTTNSFVLTVTPVNDAPTITDVGPQTISEDGMLSGVNFVVGDVETPASSLAVTATSSNPGLVPSGNIFVTGSGNAKSLSLTPTTNQFGTATITIQVGDGTTFTTDTFTLNVNSVNDLPTVTAIDPQTINEDTDTGALSFLINDVETPVASLGLSRSSSNPTLVPTNGISFGGSAGSRTVTVTPAPDQFGTATITIIVSDGSGSTSRNFTLTVNGVNDPPTLGNISNISVNEDSGTNSITLTVIGAGGGNENQSVTVTAISETPEVVPNPTVVYTSPASSGTLRFVPATNATGTAQLNVTVDDGGSSNNITTRSFTITVLPVNDAPTILPIATITVPENTSTGLIPLTISDVDSLVAGVTLSSASSNTGLVLTNNISFTGTGANRNVEILPLVNQFGSTAISIIASDGQASSTNTFTLIVTPVNDPPTIGVINNVTTPEDVVTDGVVTASDDETSPSALVFSASSANPGVIANNGITFSPGAGTRTMTLTPVPNASGASVVTVIVTDGQGLSSSNTFVYTVQPVNDPPTLNTINNLTIAEDAALQVVTLAGIGSGAVNEQQSLTVTATSSDPSIIPQPAVSYLSPNTSGSLAFTPVADASGSAVITVTVDDGQSANNRFTRDFTVNVTPVNDSPTIATVAAVTLLEDGVTNVTVTISDIETASSSLTIQAGSSNEELIDSTGISVSPTGDSRTLTLTPLANQFGSATITLLVQDAAGGTASTFVNLTVLPVNDVPFISPLANVSIPQDGSTGEIPFTISDEETFVDNLRVEARASDANLVAPSGIVLAGTGFSRSIRITPIAGRFGSTTITVEASDDTGGTNRESFVLTVIGINTPPTLAPIGPATVAEDASEQTVALTGISSGSALEIQTLTVTAMSSDTSIIPTPTIVYTSPQTTGVLKFRPAANANGSAVITVTVDDGLPEDAVSRTFTVTVTPVNDAPSITPIADQRTDKNRPSTSVLFTIGDLEDPISSLQVTASSGNTSVIANQAISILGFGAERTISMTPVNNAVGYAFITISVSDPAGLISQQTFRMTVFPVDLPPTITPIGNVTMAEDGSTTVNFTVGDEESGSDLLTVLANSSNPAVIPSSGLTPGGTGASRSLMIRPAANQSGVSEITVTVVDVNGSTTNATFQASVTPVNDLPTLNGAATISLDEDTPSGSLVLVVGDAETPADNLNVTAVSQNTTIVPDANLAVTGTGSVRSLVIQPAANQSGSATIAVTVADGQGSTTSNLVVVVNAINDPPTLNPLNTLSLAEDPGLQTVNLSGISAGPGENQTVVITASSSNPALVPNPTVIYTSPAATGTLQFTPVANATGTVTITVTVSDGQAANATLVRAFSVSLNSLNDPPTISAIGPQQVNEDVPLVLSIAVNDAETPLGSLTLTGTSGNTTLVPNANIFFSGAGSTRTVTIVPSPNQFGTTQITLQAEDGALIGIASFTLTVIAVNDPPTLDPIANFVTNSAGANPTHTINLTGIGSGAANESQSLTITTSSSNPTFLPAPTVVYSSPANTGSIRLRPGNNATGSATVSVVVTDNGTGNNSSTQTFLVNVKAPANVVPTISIIPNQTIVEDGWTGQLLFNIRDAETAVTGLSLTAKSLNTALVPDANVVIGGVGGSRSITVTPVPNAFGTAAIHMTVVDGAFGASNLTFNVTVIPVNDAPTISSVGPQNTAEDTELGPLPVTIGDVENPNALTLTATSSDTTLIPNANIRLGGVGTGRSVTITPAAALSGVATINLVVSDGTATATNSFTVTVNAVNDVPTISDIPDQLVIEDGVIAGVDFFIDDLETGAGGLSLLASSSNPALVPTGNITFEGTGSPRTLTVRPAADEFGSSTITVTVGDGLATVSDTFVVTVSPANDQPTLGAINDVEARSDSGVLNVPISGISYGPANEAQSIIVTASSSNPSLVPHPVVTYSSASTTGTLSIAPAAQAGGSAVITVTVNDGQAQNGNAVRTFTVTVDQAPTLAAIPNQILSEDQPSPSIDVTISDAETEAATLNVSATSSNPSIIASSGIALTGTGLIRQLVLTPMANVYGSATITVTVEDAAGNRTESAFMASVRPVNDPPTLDSLADRSVPAGSAAQTVNLTGIGTGATNEQQVLIVRATSSNPSIIPNPVINYASPSAAGLLTFTPNTLGGLVVITVTVEDDAFDDGSGANRTTQTFYVDVTGGTRGPALTIERVAGNIVVSWPTDAGTGFALQSCPVLTQGGAWTTVATTPSVVAGRYTVTDSGGGSAKYFRLCNGCSAPSLSIRIEGSEVVVSWAEAGSAGYVLQTSTDVAPGASWANVPGAPTVAGGFNTVRAPSTDGRRFYRLCLGCN